MQNTEITKRDEWLTFLVLAVVLAPMMSMIIVGSFGLAVWISQAISGG